MMRTGVLIPWSLSFLVVSGCAGGTAPELPDRILGHCTYTNRFSRAAECRDYHGAWSDEALREDCDSWSGEAVIGQACSVDPVLGHCILSSGGNFVRVSLPGDDAAQCGSTERGCELFGGGVFVPAPICGGAATEGGGSGLPIFQQPVRTCVDPKPGEPPGQSAGGKVCTWEMISGATEEGRSFSDYASCDRVRTQRPYYPVGPAENATRPDPRLLDPGYAAELRWVRQQIEATACVCCHSTRAPEGPSNWFVESEGNFINGFFPRGLAMGAGWIDTVGFGAYPKAQNNGFSRATPQDPTHTIFVTTDDERMRRFFERELAHRGFGREAFKNMKYGAGPLDDQRFYVPTACTNGEGVKEDGTVVWRGGKARYVYVLEATSANPTVPPNLDLPTGTRWRLDVPPEGSPLTTGAVRYGVVPPGATQRWPESGAPAGLMSGKQYLLYVTADVIQPVTRCLFTAP